MTIDNLQRLPSICKSHRSQASLRSIGKTTIKSYAVDTLHKSLDRLALSHKSNAS